MKKHFETSQTVSVSYYCPGSDSDIYTFEARNGSRRELVKVTTKKIVAKLLSAYRGSDIHFNGVDQRTKKFFKQAAGIR